MLKLGRKIVCLGGVGGLLLPFIVKAVTPLDDATNRLRNSGTGAGFNIAEPETQALQIVGAIVEGVLALLGVFFFVYVIYAGVTWATAGGNSDRVEKAKSILKNNFIGLVMVLFAGALVAYVMAAITEAAG